MYIVQCTYHMIASSTGKTVQYISVYGFVIQCDLFCSFNYESKLSLILDENEPLELLI